jgi:hypothetical protein
MQESNTSDKEPAVSPDSTQERPKPEETSTKPAHPFQQNLDVFIVRVDSLSDHMKLAMTAIAQSDRQENAKFAEFMSTKATPVSDEKNAFTIPEAHFTEFRRLERKLARSRLALISVPRSFTVALVSEFDAFMGATLKTFYRLKPDALNASERSMTYSDLMGFGSIEAAREHIVEKELETFLRSSHSEQFKTLETKLGIPLRKDLPIWKDFVELTERRNLFVHNDGIVNSQYLQVCSAEGVDCTGLKKGAPLRVSKGYFSKAHEVVYEIAAKLSHVLWRKLAPDETEAADAHFAGTLIYDLLYDKRHRLARVLADFGASTFKKWRSDFFRRALVVNRAQAYLWDGEREDGLKILDAEDWSAANNEFHVCVAALRQDFVGAVRSMKAIGPAGRPGKQGYRDWPVFRELRKSAEFQAAFEEVFGEPFGTVTVETSPGGMSTSDARVPEPEAVADAEGIPSESRSPSEQPVQGADAEPPGSKVH